MTRYADLEICLALDNQAQVDMRLTYRRAGDELPVELGQNLVVSSGVDWTALRQAKEREPFDAQEYGRLLNKLLFQNREVVQAWLDAYQTEPGPLRVRVYFDPTACADIQQVCWETLYLPPELTKADAPPGAQDTPLGLREDLPLSRYLPRQTLRPFTLAERERPKALVVVANPRRYENQYRNRIDTRKELEIARLGMPHMELAELAFGQATLENILARLRQPVDVLYLVAHGGWSEDKQKMVLLLEGAEGGGDTIPVEDFVKALQPPLPLLAVLVSCQSAGNAAGAAGRASTPLNAAGAQAEPWTPLNAAGHEELELGPALVKAGIPAALAMQGDVSEATMRAFLPAFFYDLACRGIIDQAVTAGRRAAFSGVEARPAAPAAFSGVEVRPAAGSSRPDWWMPVLFSHLHNNQLIQPSEFVQPAGMDPLEPETVYIPSGLFWMGRGPGNDVPVWETPRCPVDLPAYRIGVCPVTNEQYLAFVRDMDKKNNNHMQLVNPVMQWEGRAPSRDRLQEPVTGVNWYQAMRYCEWLRQKYHRYYTLPNEAQWEKAARGWDNTLFPWGEAWEENRCNQNADRIQPVRAYPAQSRYGCFDMLGNAPEWTASLWGECFDVPDQEYAYPWKDAIERHDPEASRLMYRVLRSGISATLSQMTCTTRRCSLPMYFGPQGNRYGFRVAWLNKKEN